MTEKSTGPRTGPATGTRTGPRAETRTGPRAGRTAGPAAEPLYVPALPARPNALDAYDRLTPEIRAAVTPLWTVPPRVGRRRDPERHAPPPPVPEPDPDPVALGLHTHRALNRIARVQRGRPAWVDTRHVESEPRPLRFGPFLPALRPVTGVERPAWQQLACAEAARAEGSGLGIRIRPASPPDESPAEGVHRLLERTAFARCPVDLLLDLGTVGAEHATAYEQALHTLNLLGPLHSWRTVVLLAGSFPRIRPARRGTPLTETYRTDRDLLGPLRDALGGHGPRLVHGDYGAHDAASADRVSDTGDDPFRGALRYTTAHTFLVGDVPAEPDHHVTVRALAREIVTAPAFRGAEYSAGDRWLRACADGEGLPGTGHPDVWICAGHIQHLTHTARELRGPA